MVVESPVAVNPSTRSSPTHRSDKVIFGLTSAALAVLWLSFFIIDVFDVLGLRTALFVDPGALRADRPALFDRIAADNGPLEWLQWGLLASGVIASSIGVGVLRERSLVDESRRLLWFAAALAVLAIEDPGDIRNQLSRLGGEVAGRTGERLGELAIFGSVALIALVGLWRVWPLVRDRTSLRRRLLLGYGVYATAGLMSATDTWYTDAGTWVRDTVFRGWMLPYENAGYFIFDHLIEESLELIAIALIVSTAWRLSRHPTEQDPSAN